MNHHKNLTSEIVDASGLPYWSEDDLLSQYRKRLDDAFGEVNVGVSFAASDVLENLDPVAFRCGFNDWLDSMCYDEVIIDGWVFFTEYRADIESLVKTYRFGYNDERDNNYCWLLDCEDETVWECDDTASLIEDGFMRNIDDLDGLLEYLISLGVLPPDSDIEEA